jgi:hypothetical protein
MKNIFTAWFRVPKLSELEMQYMLIPQTKLQWKNKPIIIGTFLIWDLENISFDHLEKIKDLVMFTPEKLYGISMQPISLKKQKRLYEEGFILFEQYAKSADEKIINLIKVHQGATHLILVSSDSDFVPSVHAYLKEHHVQWIIDDRKKKRICMHVNLIHPRLRITTFAPT